MLSLLAISLVLALFFLIALIAWICWRWEIFEMPDDLETDLKQEEKR